MKAENDLPQDSALNKTVVSTRFSSKQQKGDFVWLDEEKTEVIFVANENGRFIVGQVWGALTNNLNYGK